MEGLTGDLQKSKDLVTQWMKAPLKRPWMIARMSKVDNLRQNLATYNHTLERKVQYLLLQQLNGFKSQHEKTVSGLTAQINSLKVGSGRSTTSATAYAAQDYSDVGPIANLSPQDDRRSSHRRHSSGRKSHSPSHSPTPSFNNDFNEETMVTKPEKAIASILLVDKTNYGKRKEVCVKSGTHNVFSTKRNVSGVPGAGTCSSSKCHRPMAFRQSRIGRLWSGVGFHQRRVLCRNP